jgi:DNA polymerase
LTAALDWWREAGVDCDYTDAPQDWLAAAREEPKRAAAAVLPPAPQPGRAAAPPPEAAPIAQERGNWPATFGAFSQWWLSEPTLAPRGANRVPPSGPAGPALMVIVPMPAEDDGEVLLSGKTGRLLDAMIAAFGIDPAQVYRASALPSRIALPDWAGLAGAGLGAVLAHHIALVAPQRLLVFGRGDISTLMGHDSAHTALHLRAFNHESGSVPASFEYDLETLLTKPSWKAGVWQRWLELALANGNGNTSAVNKS